MERTITAGGNTADIAAWQEARHHYRNLLVVEHAATARSPAAASGAISPSQLHGADQAVRGRRAYARGQTDYSDLAHAGEEVLIRPPQSGTAPRVAVRAIPAILGALLGHQVEGGLGAAVGAVAAPVVAGGTMMSRPVQAALGNQLMINAPDAAASARRALLIQALTAPRQLSAPDAQ
jgi:hypothetical protein